MTAVRIFNHKQQTLPQYADHSLNNTSKEIGNATSTYYKLIIHPIKYTKNRNGAFFNITPVSGGAVQHLEYIYMQTLILK